MPLRGHAPRRGLDRAPFPLTACRATRVRLLVPLVRLRVRPLVLLRLDRLAEVPRQAEDLDVAVRERSYSQDRKSTRLNSSHANISYAVFCLKKKKQFQRVAS